VNAINYGIPRVLNLQGREDEPLDEEGHESTEPYRDSDSDSEVESLSHLVPKQLACALMAWDPKLVSSLCVAGMMHPHAAAFAAFLNKLHLAVTPDLGLRGEILGWLDRLGSNETQRQRAFQIAAEAGTGTPALAIYQAMRAASE
jgi:hypothetical protein